MRGTDARMPHCYLLAISGGSSLDQHSNNITLFNLVEQLNFPKHAPPALGSMLPLEVHAYFELEGSELNQRFEVRFVLVAESGLESPTETFTHKSTTLRYRTRTYGLPAPPVAGKYDLRVDARPAGSEAWRRDLTRWPLVVVLSEPRPAVTH
jgi:hypothetical protein